MKKLHILLKNSLIFLLIISTFFILYKYVFNTEKGNSENDIFNNSKNAIFTIKDISGFNKHLGESVYAYLPPLEFMESFGYGLGLFDSNRNIITHSSLKYTDEPMEYYISIVNANLYDDKIGLMIFVDGLLQPFYVDDEDQARIVYEYDFAKHSLVNIPVTFTPKPIEGNMSDKSRIDFVTLYQLHEKPNINKPYIPYFLNSIMCNIDFSESKYYETIKNDIQYNAEIINIRDDVEDYVPANRIVAAIGKGDYVEYIFQETRISVNKGDNVEFVIEAAGQEGTYSTLIFIDHKPVSVFDGKTHLIWTIEKGEMLSQKFMLDVPGDPREYQMYSITIPMDIQGSEPFESDKFILNVTDN